MTYETVIGLEIHIQLATKTKMFCACPIVDYEAPPNSSTCPVCLALPGSLPVPNSTAVEFALSLAHALNCTVNGTSTFARKNYFYPDLPKGYQITQDKIPIAEKGFIELPLDGMSKTIRINRIHLEEDAGKSYHPMGYANFTLIDFNRCGVPLIEIVSEPDMRSPREAAQYVAEIRQIVTYLGICSGDMEKGNLRVDANVSIRPLGSVEYGARTELKNLNSFRFLQKALDYEVERHKKLVSAGEKVHVETLLWDEKENVTISMRSKETASDYRYFLEPDILTLHIPQNVINHSSQNLSELPRARIARFEHEHGISHTQAELLCSRKDFSDYADTVLAKVSDKSGAANWLSVEIVRFLNEKNIKITEFPISAHEFADLLCKFENGELSRPLLKKILLTVVFEGKPLAQTLETERMSMVSNQDDIQQIVADVLTANPNIVQKYLSGKTNALGFLVGEIMKKTHGSANPKTVNEILSKKLQEQNS